MKAYFFNRVFFGKDSGIIYSTGLGRICPECGNPKPQCSCGKVATSPTGDGIVRIQWQTTGRLGAGVTLITGIPLGEKDLKGLAKALKKSCGVGGTIKQGLIELQGDQREFLKEALKKYAWVVKIIGG